MIGDGVASLPRPKLSWHSPDFRLNAHQNVKGSYD